MQAADLNLALEQINGLYGQGLRLIELSERLSGGLTMELALEADRVLPSLKASDLYFSAAKAQNQLALEGIVDSIVEGLHKLFKKIIDTIRRALNWLMGLGFKTREERHEAIRKKVAAEYAAKPSLTQELRHGKYDAVIEELAKGKKQQYPLLNASLWDHPGRTVAIWDLKSPYNTLVARAREYLEHASPRLKTTSSILNEAADQINRRELDRIPHTLAALKTLWGGSVEKDTQAAHDIAHGLQDTVNAALTDGTGPLKFSQAHGLYEDFPSNYMGKLSALVLDVANPLENLNKRFDALDQVIQSVNKSSDVVSRASGAKRTDASQADYRAALAAVHEVALLVFKVSTNEVTLAKVLNGVLDAHVQMSHAWLLTFNEAMKIVGIEADRKIDDINGKKK